MIAGIKRDHLRFKQIVKGKIKENLKKYISHGELIGRQGKDYVSVMDDNIRSLTQGLDCPRHS